MGYKGIWECVMKGMDDGFGVRAPHVGTVIAAAVQKFNDLKTEAARREALITKLEGQTRAQAQRIWEIARILRGSIAACPEACLELEGLAQQVVSGEKAFSDKADRAETDADKEEADAQEAKAADSQEEVREYAEKPRRCAGRYSSYAGG